MSLELFDDLQFHITNGGTTRWELAQDFARAKHSRLINVIKHIFKSKRGRSLVNIIIQPRVGVES